MEISLLCRPVEGSVLYSYPGKINMDLTVLMSLGRFSYVLHCNAGYHGVGEAPHYSRSNESIREVFFFDTLSGFISEVSKRKIYKLKRFDARKFEKPEIPTPRVGTNTRNA